MLRYYEYYSEMKGEIMSPSVLDKPPNKPVKCYEFRICEKYTDLPKSISIYEATFTS